MRKIEKEIFDRSIIEKIIKESEICRIGFCDNNQAYIVPVNYAYDNNCLYIHSAPEGRKIDFIKKNPYVCFEIEYKPEIKAHEIPCKWTTKYRSVIGYGSITIINEGAGKKEGLDYIMSKYLKKIDFNYEYKKETLKKLVILKIEIEKIAAKQSGIWDE
jgi:nitroimidazol reductase NimA-like FMN-containing flavoprotein (pyridoxamine 5'-phosphate oxidase superfamily)